MPQGMNQPVNQPQQIQQGQQQAQGLSQTSRPVTSREEAMGVAADFSGSLMVFPDIAHNRVYIKRWNYQAGAADFVEFAPVIQAQAQQEPVEIQPVFAPLDALQELQGTVDDLRQEIDKLKRAQPKGAVRKEKGESNE